MILHLKPNFIVTLLLLALVSACAELPNYAPVISHFPEPHQDQYHVVQSGETLQTISASRGLDLRLLAQWNNLSPPYLVKAGQKLRLFNPNLSATVKKQPDSIGSTKSKITPPKKVFIPAEKPLILASKPKIKPPVEAVENEKISTAKEKKSTISIDKEKVLKLNFQWPIKGRVLKKFSHSNNKGIDIAGKDGQLVAAAEAGKVVYSGQGLLGYGNLLIIKHNDVYLSAYANNNRLLVGEGDVVNKGQTVAEVGQIGSKRVALHFEIRKNGKPVDPLMFLSKK